MSTPPVITDPEEARLIAAVEAAGLDGGVLTSDAIEALNAYREARHQRSIAYWQRDSAAAWNKCEEKRKALDAVWGELTELRNLWDRYLGVADPARMVGNCDITDQIEKVRGLVAEGLK